MTDTRTRWVVTILLLAVLARVVAALVIGGSFKFADEAVYVDTAQRLAAGEPVVVDPSSLPTQALEDIRPQITALTARANVVRVGRVPPEPPRLDRVVLRTLQSGGGDARPAAGSARPGGGPDGIGPGADAAALKRA